MSSERLAPGGSELALQDQYAIPAAEPVPAPEIEEEVEDERLTVASQWQLIWWRFRKHKIALVCGVLLVLFYLIAAFAEFVAPYDPNDVRGQYKYVNPVLITFVDPDGNFVPWPGVNLLTSTRDPETLRITYVPDRSTWYPIQFFVEGSAYKLWGMFPSNIHLFGVGPDVPEQTMFLLGTDRLGRDLLSRILFGARMSLSIGLVGVTLSFLLGVTFG